ncbi:MAG: SRPBCC domain-containing protein [Actinomycetia bacterium]|nr:SRPBCC domain-containing protein [Actinomycetes bacterium]
MTIANIEKNQDDLTMIVTVEYDASVDRVWQLWEDPRKLERWWGPPTYPATFVDFDLKPGGDVNYYMTSPEGERLWGWWQFISIDAPKTLEFRDGFSDGDGVHKPDMPTTTVVVSLTERGTGGTVMTITSRWSSLAQMSEMMDMGMEEGMRSALSQIDELLA